MCKFVVKLASYEGDLVAAYGVRCKVNFLILIEYQLQHMRKPTAASDNLISDNCRTGKSCPKKTFVNLVISCTDLASI